MTRTPARPVEPLFVERWSPRAFDATPVSEDDLATLFEAARWAPSSFNVQPWRFLYAHRDTPDWARMLGVLVPFNQLWAKQAGLLVLALSDTLMTGPDGATKPSHSHSFDVGAAWALLALQATRLGLAAHGMTGVDFDAARTAFAVPERYRIEAAIAVGRPGDKASLPEGLQAREFPSDRKPVAAFAFAGDFPAE